ncbi:hypothetical protein BOTBODRAFT_185081 [Botryobasidium botryosum FD-172 SS1]|uniref:HNH nuclease domain-containing protein n=1 Tax=Botryobasidium botryosum (strain FD-172 SS1) TaxID=930990 RepID=A0A067N407_BOTB1|nr:hypothetical protein BOTBODRAFT_185081 [Botryobasidium botryosum FD-172 SS1]
MSNSPARSMESPNDQAVDARPTRFYVNPRNIRIYDSRGIEVAGAYQSLSGIWTGNRLYRALDICFVPPSVCWWLVRQGSGDEFMRDNTAVEHGANDVMGPDGPLEVENTPIPLIERTLTPKAKGPRESSFTTPLRSQDGKCVITGKSPYGKRWTAIDASHIVPLAQAQLFNEQFAPLLTDDTFPEGQPLNSVQNGLLLGCEFHAHWAKHDFSIDPDDGYRIVCFSSMVETMVPHPEHALGLRRADIPDNQRVLDEVLRRHYTQAVLGNIRGAGKLRDDSWEEDLRDKNFSEPFDLSQQRWPDPRRKEFLEGKLSARLYDIAHRRSASMYVV